MGLGLTRKQQRQRGTESKYNGSIYQFKQEDHPKLSQEIQKSFGVWDWSQ